VLLFSILAAFLTGISFGVWPALRSTQPRTTAASSQGQRLHTLLIAGQVSLTLLLLAGAGASIRTFLRLYQSPLGFDPHHVLTVSLQFPDGTHTQLDERQNFYASVRQKIAALPGVEAAAIYPFGFPPQAHSARQLDIFDQPASTGRSVYTNPVSREFFEALRIPMLQGRTWSEQETRRASHVAIVNQSFARRYWPNRSAIGHKIRLPDFTAFTTWMLAHPGSNDWLEVVGVVGDTPNDGLSRPVGAAVYVPYSLVLGDSFNLAIRTQGDPLAITRDVRQAVHTASASQPVSEIRTAEEILSAEGWSTERFIAALFLLFAGLALALAAIGLYSVVSLAVTERYREFGIRMALGAQRAAILKLVLASGVRAVALGLAGGLVLCLFSNGALRHWTQSSMYDPGVILPVSFLLFFVMISASMRPAWRASTVDPIKVLRDEFPA
jgi:predicted permease